MIAPAIPFSMHPSITFARDTEGIADRAGHDIAAGLHGSWLIDPSSGEQVRPLKTRKAGIVRHATWPTSLSATSAPTQLFVCLVEHAYRQLLEGDASGALRTLEHARGTIGRLGSPSTGSIDGGPSVVYVSNSATHAPQSTETAQYGRPHTAQRVRVRTLGRFEILLDGANISSGRKHPRRTLALLQALIAFGGRQVSRTALTDALWPDADGDQAHNALEAALHRLRRRLTVPSAIVCKHGGLEIDPQHVWVDALAFDNVYTNSLHQPGINDGSAPLERAFELYGGAFLPEDGASWWAVRSRERLRGRFVGVVAGAAASMEACNRFDAAAQLYERAIMVDDLVCVFHEGLIRCLRRLGRQAEAETALQRKQKLVTAGIC